MPLPPWKKMPVGWIQSGGLANFRWRDGGSDELAALMVFVAIVHHADADTGLAHLTFDQMTNMTALSRVKVANGLGILQERGIVGRWAGNRRSAYQLEGYDPAGGWAMLPARGLYQGDVIYPFDAFKLRQPAELDAMRLYLTFAARRDRDDNLAHITYDQIEEYCGVARPNIRRALSVLAANGLVHVERLPSAAMEAGVANAYRLTHLNPYVHMGTKGRADPAARAFDL